MLKFSVIILTFMFAYAAMYSLVAIIMPELVLKSTLQASIGKTLEQAQNDGYLKVLTTTVIYLGGLALALVIAGFFILIIGFRKAQKWAWWALLVVCCIGWSVGLIINAPIGETANVSLHIVGLVIFLVGLGLPVKTFFTKVAEQAPPEAEESQET